MRNRKKKKKPQGQALRVEDWHIRQKRSDMEEGRRRRMGWRWQESGFVKVKKKQTNRSHPAQSLPVSLIQLQSLPGLVEEDVSRLRVLRDV